MVLDGCGPSAYRLPVVVGLNFYSFGSNGAWYQFGFLLGAGAPFGGGVASRGGR